MNKKTVHVLPRMPCLGDTVHLWAVVRALAARGEASAPMQVKAPYAALFEYGGVKIAKTPGSLGSWYPFQDMGRWPRHPEDGVHIRDTLARLVGVEKEDLSGRLPIGITQRYVPPKFILLCPHAGHRNKEWSDANWWTLAKELKRMGYHVIINHDPTRPSLRLSEVSACFPPLVELVAYIHHAACVVAVDSGPLHLADALGNPPVGLYATTSPTTYGPYNDASYCIDHHRDDWDMAVPYATWKHNPANAMKSIGVEEVLEQVKRRLARS